MKTVREVSRITGVSVRTLHHYDAIGLLKPAQVTESGYRLYDEQSLERLRSILLFRELRFPLKEIRRILDTPGFDPNQALAEQIRLLELQREHLDQVIEHARKLHQNGGFDMDFSAFDNKKYDDYAAQAKQKWGGTDAWKEYEHKAAGQSKEKLRSDGDALMDIFRKLGEIRKESPFSPAAQALVQELQNFITDHYYTCTTQILRGLGQMYIAGGEMTENIDRAGGEGTAAFAHAAIMHYCK